jgi:Flp pilus assembly protein TadB
MSAVRASGDVPRSAAHMSRRPRDMSQLRSRRRESRRRRRLARVDLGLGLLGAIVVLLATPGLAIATMVALVVLALVIASVVLERRRSRKP